MAIPDKHKGTGRSKTSFALAQPPPAKHKQRLNIRPRLLLQLHQISIASRPTPVLDVIPSVIFAPKFARKVPRIFKGKDDLGPNDLVIVKSQKYDALDEEAGHVDQDHSGDTRELVAVIRQRNINTEKDDSRAEIIFSNGRSCDAAALRTGRYDFVFLDDDGCRTTARWVPRQPARFKPRDHSIAEHEEARHTFSLIDPRTRRHPIIATLTSRSMEIYDSYSASPPRLSPEPSSPSSRVPLSPQMEESDYFGDLGHGTVGVDENLRTLITVTGIWVVFQEGFSPFYDAHRSLLPLTPEPKSPRMNGTNAADSNAIQSTSFNYQSHSHHPGVSGEYSPSSTASSGISKGGTAQSQIRRAYTTGGTSPKLSAQEQNISDSSWCPKEGRKLDLGICQHFRHERRRNTVDSGAISTYGINPTGSLGSATSQKDSATHHLRDLPEGGDGLVVRPGRIKRLFGFGR